MHYIQTLKGSCQVRLIQTPKDDKTLVFHAAGMSVCDAVGMRMGWVTLPTLPSDCSIVLEDYLPAAYNLSLDEFKLSLYLHGK